MAETTSVPPLSPLYVPIRAHDPVKISSAAESMAGLMTVPMDRSLSTAERWGLTLDRVVKGIVSIKFTILRAFERSGAGQCSATGFVVDRTRGIILSNRHVVNPGPIIATALFNRYEEIPVEPLYADPVHDFGFFKFNPSQLKFAELEEIELYPQGARVGLDIKVCGSDGGEMLSVLSGMLARLDRASPVDNDFNTFYFQAASGSSTGSSGSPVLDVQGRAVALCAAGSTSSASSFYLPLDKVQRALRLIQQGKHVARGTLQTDFEHRSYDRLRKMGLPDAIEKDSRARHVDGTGLLIIDGVVPEGPGDLAGFRVGDILLKINHPSYGEQFVNNFYSLWDVLDEIVDDSIKLTVCRGMDLHTMEATVQDLHSIIPNEFLEVGAGIVHSLSYQAARFNNIPCRGLIVPEGGMFSWLNANTPFILTEFDGKEVTTLDELIPILLSVPDKKKVKYKYRGFGSWQVNIALIEMDHHFFGMTLFKRVNSTWERRRFRPVSGDVPLEIEGTFDVERELTWSEELRRNLVWVSCRLPFSVEVLPYHVATNFRDSTHGEATLDLECWLQSLQSPSSLFHVILYLFRCASYLSLYAIAYYLALSSTWD
jgi:pro-apoptotic serine protease NMA111